MNSGQNSSTQSQTTQGQRTSEFTEHERDVTGYLFAKFLVLYSNTFYFVWPSEKELNLTKREYAREIGKFSREQIDIAILHLAKLAVSPERENRIYREPNVIAFLSLLDEVSRGSPAHRLFLPVPIETEEAKAARIEEGKRQSNALLALFEAKEPPLPTEAELKDLEKLERIKNG